MKALPLVVAGILGGLAGGLLVKLLFPAPEAARASTRASAPAGDWVGRDEFEAFRRDVATSIASRPTAAEPDPLVSSAHPRETAATPGSTPASPGPTAAALSAAEVLQELLGKPFGSAESSRLFGWLIANKEQIDDAIKRLEAEVARDPQSADLRTMLATAFVGKLLNVTPGPQQGIIWQQAEAAYASALEINPDHWQARFGRAFGTSQIPAFLGRRPEAIRQFEELEQRQEALPAQPEHANTYFQLGNLYKDAGNIEKARSVWERGRKLFPDSKELKEAIEVTQKQ